MCGDTYYIADGTYGSYEFKTSLKGESYIYVKKATEKDHGANMGWNASYGDGEALFTSGEKTPIVFKVGYIDMDENPRGKDGSWDVGAFEFVSQKTKIASRPADEGAVSVERKIIHHK